MGAANTGPRRGPPLYFTKIRCPSSVGWEVWERTTSPEDIRSVSSPLPHRPDKSGTANCLPGNCARTNESRQAPIAVEFSCYLSLIVFLRYYSRADKRILTRRRFFLSME